MKKYAVIVAGGSGSRMRSELPKQFLTLGNEPVIARTIRKFQAYADQIVVVVPEARMELWLQLKNVYFPNLALLTTSGGDTRTRSVKNGLALIGGEGLVAIHDAARPLVDGAGIEESYRQAEMTGSGVLAVPLKDSIRKWEGTIAASRDRTHYMLMQTPQTFQLELLKKAYECIADECFTDDASVFEAAGHAIQLVEGTYENIKITTPEDLFVAEAILKYQSEKPV